MKPLVTRGVTSLLVVVVLLLLGCAKHPVIYRDPSFDRTAIKSRAVAFILPDSIDIKPVVDEFVFAFDGDPADGIKRLRTCLGDCLTGREIISTGEPSPKQERLKLVDFSELTDLDQVLGLLKWETDQYGVTSLSITFPDTLADLLARCKITHLVILSSFALSRQTSREYQSPMLAKPPTLSGIRMTSQGFVWSRDAKALVWSGFVSGWSPNVNERGLRRLTNSFAYDLWSAME